MRHIVASSILLSSLLFPAAASASKPSDDASAPTQAPRVSTGVVAPVLLNTINLRSPDDLLLDTLPAGAQVGLTLTVDAKGQPQDIHVVKGIGPLWDARVVEAVSKLHYRAGTIDEQAVPMDLNLTVNIER